MKKILAPVIPLAMAATYILLAVQAEPVTATLGYIFSGLLVVAVIVQTTQKGNS